MTSHFPFTAIVGQESTKTALLLISIDPKIGGVLLSGPRGSAKSTIVRSLAGLIQKQASTQNHTQAFVNVPLGATEEMVTGSFDLEKALNSGEVSFRPGLLAKADQGILYVDEVNLLADHLVDLLLDAAASGVNRVERDAISHEHKAEFSLIGTMNPDEGELRPQLLDRFGLVAQVATDFSIAQRQQVVSQRIAFDQDPAEFMASHQAELDALAALLATARESLSGIILSDEISLEIAQRCAQAQVDGFRADITLHRAATAHAALAGRTQVSIDDIETVEPLVLAHRRNSPPDQSPPPNNSSSEQADNKSGSNAEQSGSSIEGSWGKAQTQKTASAITQSINFDVDAAQTAKAASPALTQSKNKQKAKTSTKVKTFTSVFGFAKAETPRKINWAQTLGTSNAFKALSGSAKKGCLKFKFAKPQSVNLDLILLDTSASTLGGQGLERAKGVIASLSKRNYRERKHTAIITFGNNTVNTLLHPQRSPKNIHTKLDAILAGGGTPITKALDSTQALIKRNQYRYDQFSLTLITDGRIDNIAQHHQVFAQCAVTLVDIESSRVKLGLAKGFADAIKALYVKVSEAQPITRAINPITSN